MIGVPGSGTAWLPDRTGRCEAVCRSTTVARVVAPKGEFSPKPHSPNTPPDHSSMRRTHRAVKTAKGAL